MARLGFLGFSAKSLIYKDFLLDGSLMDAHPTGIPRFLGQVRVNTVNPAAAGHVLLDGRAGVESESTIKIFKINNLRV